MALAPGVGVGERHGAPTGDRTRHLLGLTAELRPIWAYWRGPEPGELRVLIVAGQHGDEGRATEVARRLLDPASFETPDRAEVQVAVVPDVNPDGAAQHRRTNGQGIDLNRDHALLETAEIAALHRFVRDYSPHLVVDLHTYPSRRRAALARGWVLDDDVLLATATNPAVRSGLPASLRPQLVPFVEERLGRDGFAVSEYKLFQPGGRVRRSTLAPVDLRNALALRYGVLTVLVEGRDPRRTEDADQRSHLLEAQFVAVEEILAWAVRHRAALAQSSPTLPSPGEPVEINARWGRSVEPFHAMVRESGSLRRRRVTLEESAGEVKVTRRTALPWGYAIPSGSAAMVAWLERQGFSSVRWASSSPPPHAMGSNERVVPVLPQVDAPEFHPDEAGPASDDPPDAWHVVPVQQPGGHALAVWLDPKSKFGLAHLLTGGRGIGSTGESG